MALINWNDNLSVKVAEIDQQHQRLIAMINDLTDAIKQGKGSVVAREILRELISYAELHFQTEETYFERFGYPEIDSHKKEHADFIQQISDFSKGTVKKELSLSITVLQFLGDWLVNHILGTDKAYSAFFNEKGLK